MTNYAAAGRQATTAPNADPDNHPILVDTTDAVRTITLNRPAALNSFDSGMKHAMLSVLNDAASDDDVRVVVITGAGSAFCAGQDLKEHLVRVRAQDPRVAETVTEFYNPMIRTITTMNKPVIAVINGVAAGAGAALAFACDARIAASSASFSMAFARVALSADSGASFTLPRLIGRGRAMRLMMTGEKVGAVEALRIGMVDEVVNDEALADRVHAVAVDLANSSTVALGWIKASLRYGETHSLDETLEFENEAQVACFASPDHREALDAFVEKRRPTFRP
ncbi:MAG: enoyl-CoA hydratase-related protein [Nakamurella sp.]